MYFFNRPSSPGACLKHSEREITIRNLIVLTFLSLDGVMQAPGGPEEDTSGVFKHGGWTVSYFDEIIHAVMDEQMKGPLDLLLGRRTYDIFVSYWPQHPDVIPAFTDATKYVASRTPLKLTWDKSVQLQGDVAEAVKKLKAQDGPDLQVHGSGNLIQTLSKHDLVDEFWLKIFPVTLGPGKRLFAERAIPAAFKLTDSKVSPSGVIVANYKRAGEVKTGTF